MGPGAQHPGAWGLFAWPEEPSVWACAPQLACAPNIRSLSVRPPGRAATAAVRVATAAVPARLAPRPSLPTLGAQTMCAEKYKVASDMKNVFPVPTTANGVLTLHGTLETTTNDQLPKEQQGTRHPTDAVKVYKDKLGFATS